MAHSCLLCPDGDGGGWGHADVTINQHSTGAFSLEMFVWKVPLKDAKIFVLFPPSRFLPRSTPGFPGTGRNCGGPLGPGVLDSWDMGVPGFIPGVLDFSLCQEQKHVSKNKINKLDESFKNKVIRV